MGKGVGPRRIETAHDVGAPAKCADRQTAGNILAKCDEIGLYAEMRLQAAEMNARRHDLIEDQKHAMLLGGLAQGCDERGVGRKRARAALHRLDDDRRKLTGIVRNVGRCIFSISLKVEVTTGIGILSGDAPWLK